LADAPPSLSSRIRPCGHFQQRNVNKHLRLVVHCVSIQVCACLNYVMMFVFRILDSSHVVFRKVRNMRSRCVRTSVPLSKFTSGCVLWWTWKFLLAHVAFSTGLRPSTGMKLYRQYLYVRGQMIRLVILSVMPRVPYHNSLQVIRSVSVCPYCFPHRV
jgi:hypothetical protein